MLGAMRLMAEHPVPVLGINFGTVGFLVETHPTEMADALTIRPARNRSSP